MCVFDFMSGFYYTIVTIILNFTHIVHIFNILTHLYLLYHRLVTVQEVVLCEKGSDLVEHNSFKCFCIER